MDTRVAQTPTLMMVRRRRGTMDGGTYRWALGFCRKFFGTPGRPSWRCLLRILYAHTVSAMASFDPFRPEVERAWVRLRGKQIAARTGCSQGIGEAEAMCELQKLREAGAPMPWEGKVTPINRGSQGT